MLSRGVHVESVTLPVIKTLWIGTSLGEIEHLSLRSFLSHGHNVELFTYGEVGNVPAGVTLRDAEDILPRHTVFQYNNTGSYAGFADWFRYALLFAEGGVWVDTDVVCLKAFDFSDELLFGKEEYNRYNNAVLGGAKGSELFSYLETQAKYPNRWLPTDSLREKKRKLKRKLFFSKRYSVDWGEVGPTGLTKAVEYFNLTRFARSQIDFYPIHCRNWNLIFDQSLTDVYENFPHSYSIHLWNEMLNRSGVNKQIFPESSLISALNRLYPK